MSNIISLSYSKTLKLNNVLVFEVIPSVGMNLDLEVKKMENYIKSKGCQPIGPLIQHTLPTVSEDDSWDFVIKFFRQSSYYINHIEPPYAMESVLRVQDCMYVRFAGKESNLRFAYDKINLTAYEEDIELKGDSYTVFVDRMDDSIVADVFMEKKHG